MDELQKEIDAKAVAPRITPADIEANIVGELYFTAADGALGYLSITDADPIQSYRALHQSMHLLTFCVLVLRNGFTVTGESACASPENFDAEIGRKIARQNATEKIWPLLGFSLKQKLHEAAK